MHTKSGVQEFVEAVEEIKNQGGKIAFGGKVSDCFLYNVLINFSIWC